MPIQVNECDPDLYLFLVRHPEVVVNIWEVMKISNVALGTHRRRHVSGLATGPARCAHVKFCYTDHETQVIYAEGSYEGPLFTRPVKAKCVLILKSGYMQETNGRYYVTSRMDTFIQIEHAGVELLAKTLAAAGASRGRLQLRRDGRRSSARFRARPKRTRSAWADWPRKLTNVEPEVRDRFAELALEIGHKRAEA